VASVARVPLADLADPANRFRVRHSSGYIGPAFGVAGMVVWGFTAALLDALLTASGLSRPWDTRDVRPLPPVGTHAAALPGDEDEDEDDVPGGGADDTAPPVVADGAPDGSATRTVPGR
jgi:hypothetical protein